tara:strand:- start:23514 stop:23786 length:273 start_codon:yes stop_codon:yes gene_type:complete
MTDIFTRPPRFRYEVHTDTICQGWINSWTVSDGNEAPYFDSFQSVDKAHREISELIADVQREIDAGTREPEDAYDPEGYRVYDNVARKYV